MFTRITTSVCTARPTEVWGARPMFGALFGILALLLQVMPALATSEDGIWIEICSDLGPVMMQIDASETPVGDAPDCPECENCTLCATATQSLLADPHTVKIKPLVHQSTGFSILASTANLPKHLRPVTRGPPSATEHSAAHLPRLSQASTQLNGGAPWT